jgi:hypothetical protein
MEKGTIRIHCWAFSVPMTLFIGHRQSREAQLIWVHQILVASCFEFRLSYAVVERV